MAGTFALSCDFSVFLHPRVAKPARHISRNCDRNCIKSTGPIVVVDRYHRRWFRESRDYVSSSVAVKYKIISLISPPEFMRFWGKRGMARRRDSRMCFKWISPHDANWQFLQVFISILLSNFWCHDLLNLFFGSKILILWLIKHWRVECIYFLVYCILYELYIAIIYMYTFQRIYFVNIHTIH